jgi:hypothetical protein
MLAATTAFAATPQWTIQQTFDPAGATAAELAGVSCPSSAACTAVGSYTQGSGRTLTLAERWNGIRWVIQPTPDLAGATAAELAGVSCPSPAACTAVGSYTNGSGRTLTLAERWTGSRWMIQRTPDPPDVADAALYGVSCASVTACVAVGFGDGGTLAERWNGSMWELQSTPNLSGAMSSMLLGVSCSSTNACTAVGYGSFFGGEVAIAPLAERWDGSTWAIQAIPDFNGMITELVGVSCPATNACTAVGDWGDAFDACCQTLAERWNGTGWVRQATPNPPNPLCCLSAVLSGVSCRSPEACIAVGSFYDEFFGVVPPGTLAEGWDGGSWTLQSTPNPAGATVPQLLGVSCSSTAACSAVGVSYLSASSAALVERYAVQGAT